MLAFRAGIPVEVTQEGGAVPRCRRAAIRTPFVNSYYHNQNTRNRNSMIMQHFNRSTSQSCFIFQSTKEWNTSPMVIKSSNTLQTFKNKTKNTLLQPLLIKLYTQRDRSRSLVGLNLVWILFVNFLINFIPNAIPFGVESVGWLWERSGSGLV